MPQQEGLGWKVGQQNRGPDFSMAWYANNLVARTSACDELSRARQALSVWSFWFIWLIWFIWSIWLVWFNQINKTNQINQINEMD